MGGSGPILPGKDWPSQIRLDWRQIQHVHSPSPVGSAYPAVFQDSLGTLQGFHAKIMVEPGVTPRFNPVRAVP